MKTSETLDFVAMCKILPTYSRRLDKRQKLETVINAELKELGNRIYKYNGKGELNIKITIEPDSKRNQLKLKAIVSTKLPEEKVEAELYQDNSGLLYADNPDQGKLEVVYDINENRKEEKTC